MEKHKCPEIKFNGFEQYWCEKKLKDFSIKVTEKNISNIYTETFTNSAQYGVVSQRDFFDKSISNENNIKGYYIVRENDFIYNPRISIYAPVGPIKRNKLGRIGVVSPLYFVFRTKDIDLQFLETYFESSKWHSFMLLSSDSGARSDRLAIKDSIFIEMPIFFPDYKVQKYLGDFFQNLDKSIALHSKKLTLTQNFKKAMLEKMFPKQGSSRPEIRLKRFSEDWKIEAIGDVLQEVFRPIDLDNEVKYRLVTVKRRNGGIAERAILKGKDILVKSQFEVKAGDYIISKRQVVHGATGLVPPELDGSVVSNEYLVGQGTEKLSIEFFALLSTLPEMYQKFFLSSYGVDIEKLFFDVNDWKKREVLLPSLEEQVRISSFFKQVDETLKLQKQQLQTLKNLKQALLEKIFV